MSRHDLGEALISACSGGDTRLAESLLDQKADPDYHHDYGCTNPLFIASEHNRIDCVRLLLRHKADAGWTNVNNETPLSVSQREGHVSVARLLASRLQHPLKT